MFIFIYLQYIYHKYVCVCTYIISMSSYISYKNNAFILTACSCILICATVVFYKDNQRHGVYATFLHLSPYIWMYVLFFSSDFIFFYLQLLINNSIHICMFIYMKALTAIWTLRNFRIRITLMKWRKIFFNEASRWFPYFLCMFLPSCRVNNKCTKETVQLTSFVFNQFYF